MFFFPSIILIDLKINEMVLEVAQDQITDHNTNVIKDKTTLVERIEDVGFCGKPGQEIPNGWQNNLVIIEPQM